MDYLFALALLSIVVFVFALRSQQDAEALEDRLAGTIDEEAASHPHQAGGIEPLPEWIQPAARFGLKLAGNDKSRETTALLLAQAGFARPGSLGVFAPQNDARTRHCGCALFRHSGAKHRHHRAHGAGYFAGGILPEWILKSMAARRYTALERSMPDALDLMVICAEAGLPFTRIVKVVSRELNFPPRFSLMNSHSPMPNLKSCPSVQRRCAISPSVRACRLLKAWFQRLFKPNSSVRLWRRRSTTLPPNLGRP